MIAYTLLAETNLLLQSTVDQQMRRYNVPRLSFIDKWIGELAVGHN